jgi:hypothetical protein
VLVYTGFVRILLECQFGEGKNVSLEHYFAISQLSHGCCCNLVRECQARSSRLSCLCQSVTCRVRSDDHNMSSAAVVIVFSGVPVMWQSKLQTETAISTMEAEIIALAACMRELIPIVDMVQSLAVAVSIPAGDVNMKVSVHEDNSGALVLAEILPPQFTPRIKYYAIKTIWFREEIHKRGINLLKIDTTEQLGDIFTKGLSQPTFEYLRSKITGW